jgi:glutamate-1-semialdehyde 2,1-aminomutase
MAEMKNSIRLFQEAQYHLPGGVDSPVRAFKAVGGSPPFIKRGKGSRIYDVDGNEYIDYVCSWGPLILGHAHLGVVKAIKRAIDHGTTFGAPNEMETTLAKLACEAVPSMKMIRFVNSGTEAVMSAIRLARAATGRGKVVKFAGGYHGHSDGLLAKAGSGVTTLGIPDSPGVPTSFASETLIAQYNDQQSTGKLFSEFGQSIAAVILEPIAGNMGVVPPKTGFLEYLRQLTEDSGALLIFDEVITGFRVAYGGAQTLYKIVPDLTCLGKIIGGGLPIGAYGGRREIMQLMAPSGLVYQAGTLSGNPTVMAAGIETLRILSNPEVYIRLERSAALLEEGLTEASAKYDADVQVSRIGSMLTVFFTKEPVTDLKTATQADSGLYSQFFHQMLSRGIYLPPSQFEACFVSAAHSTSDIHTTVSAAEESFSSICDTRR